MPSSLHASDPTTAQEITGSRELSFPIPDAPSAMLLSQQFYINKASYSRVALDTAHPDGTAYPNFYLVDEQPFRRKENLIYFERQYATIPSSVPDEPVDFSYTFPGREGGWGLLGRAPLSLSVLARFKREFFLDPRPTHQSVTAATGTASTDVIAASGHPFLDGDRVTFVSGTTFTGFTAGTTYFARDVSAGTSFKLAATAGGSAVNLTADGTAGVFTRGIPVIPRQRYYVTAYGLDYDYLLDGATTPSWTTYAGWIAAKTEIIPVESKLVRYDGNIWERRTPYIVAQ